MRFWLDRGVDGFRVDTVNMYSKGDMADAPVTDEKSEWQCRFIRLLLGKLKLTIQSPDTNTATAPE
jgi:glycosidase